MPDPSVHGTGNPPITVDARPQAIAMDPATSAVIVIDMQNAFGSVGGMFERAGIDISSIQKAVEPTARVLSSARAAGIRIVHVNMAYESDLSGAGAPDAPNWTRHLPLGGIGGHLRAPDGRDERILIKGTWNAAIVPELTPAPSDLVIYKTRYSGFYDTDLDAVLKQHGIEHLVFTGCTTSVCVESTVRDAMFRDYSCLLLEDCMGEPIGNGLPRSNHEATLLVLEILFAWISDSTAFINALESSMVATA